MNDLTMARHLIADLKKATTEDGPQAWTVMALEHLAFHLESQKSPDTPGSETTSPESDGASPETTTPSTLGMGITEPTNSPYPLGWLSGGVGDPTPLPQPSKTTAPTSSSPSTEPSTGPSVGTGECYGDGFTTEEVHFFRNANFIRCACGQVIRAPSSSASAGGESEETLYHPDYGYLTHKQTMSHLITKEAECRPLRELADELKGYITARALNYEGGPYASYFHSWLVRLQAVEAISPSPSSSQEEETR